MKNPQAPFDPTPRIHREVKELSLIFEISQVLSRSLDLREVAAPLLETMAQSLGMLRGTLTLLNRETGEISIEAAHGLSKSQRGQGRYKVGEGITGRVVQTGEPIVVPKISENAAFLNRTGARRSSREQELSFICVPIKIGNEVVGTLSADRLYMEKALLDDDVRLLSIIASLIAQAVRVRQAAEEERQRLLEENTRLQAALKDRFHPSNIISNDRTMQAIYEQIAQVSRSTATVLIRGESGTGKELVASSIHFSSLRAQKPFIRVNCAALPESIIESELFGHEKGAFTGALSRRKGRFELAEGGTLFLDEIGDLSPATQVKLLRVLQEREFERVGGQETIHVDVRVLAATNRDLEDLMAAGLFRQDLYYRLNVFTIHLPPLRKRKSDILLLADHFAEVYAKANHKTIRRISTPAIDMLLAYHWPGNVRELENCIERAVILSEDGVIYGHHLPPTLQTAEASGTIHHGSLETAVKKLERELLMDALKSARGNKAKAARALGLTERVMGLRLDEHELDYRDFRPRQSL
ncbi:MAG TPA: sigma 54-interacting transcriptional regulator [Holophaga sp.]|jgi:Nif-specific regulatory protein|nr:sigma 54-interacting transcriptional regulator [Holophaga sp.]